MLDAAKIKQVQEQYGLTTKQAAYVIETVEHPTETVAERARRAGYALKSAKSEGYAPLRKATILNAIEALAARRAAIAKEYKDFDADPRQYIEKRALINSTDERVTTTMHASLDLLANIRGLKKERIEVDPGEFLRSQLYARMSGKDENG